MADLTAERCVACRPGSPMVTPAEVAELKPLIPDWDLVADGVDKLVRTYRFPNFVEALAFTDTVGGAAEEEGHHPLLITEWGRTTVQWWTHAIDGLHRNDFIMAAKTDALYRGPGP